MEAAEELRELRALVERAGGRRAVLLVAEVAEGAPVASTLASFARDLLGDEAPPLPAPTPGCPSRSRCRSRGEGGRRALSAGLLLVLCRGGAARGRGNRARLREVVRDVRGRLPSGSPPAAVVGVLLPGGDGEDAAVLDATLRRHFPAPGTVQGARYSPGSPAALRECRAAACRALRAALQHPADRPQCPFLIQHITALPRKATLELSPLLGRSQALLIVWWSWDGSNNGAHVPRVSAETSQVPRSVQSPHEEEKERERWRLPAFLPCTSWSRRSRRKGHISKDANNVHEGDQQDPQEVALTSLSPNGNYEEAAGGAGT